MSRCVRFLPCALLFLLAILLFHVNARSGGSPPSAGAAASFGRIQHVVIIFQENRTPDNLFQDEILIGRGADIAKVGVNSKGQPIPLGVIDLGTNGTNPDNYDLSHTHKAFMNMYDGGKMDAADLVGVICASGATNCPPEDAQFKYVSQADVKPYFDLAEQYTFADRMFQTNQGPSYPAHMFIISGTSAPTATSNSFVAENPNPSAPTGCLASATAYTKLINPAGDESRTYPCFEHPTVTDLLDSREIMWRYYTPLAGYIWTPPNSIEHMCGPNAPPPHATACVGADWTGTDPKVSISKTQVLTDIANGNLPPVSWVIPTALASDHAMVNDGSGPSWVASIVNAIGNSPYWADTAIFITWDDWGGWYDHVPPPKVLANCAQWGCGYVYGFRVPLIVVSPYAKRRYISHVNHDFGSILRFIEETFGLPSLGYADTNALDDLSDCFNFYQPPFAFRTISAPLSADYFLNDDRPATDPDDD